MARRVDNRVRALREARGLSQTALAEAASLSRQSVSAIETARSTPAVDVALRIARALDCRVEELFTPPPAQPFRRELESLGYDARPSGERVATSSN